MTLRDISTRKRDAVPVCFGKRPGGLWLATAVAALIVAQPGLAAGRAGVSNCSALEFDLFDSPPSLQSAPIAEYSGVARLAQISGVVEMRVWVLGDGSVCEVEVLRGPHAILNSSARRAMLSAKYDPALAGDMPVPGVAECSYLFDFVKLEDGKSIFGADSEATFISKYIDSGEAARFTDGGMEYIEFEGVEVRGDMPVEMFRWIRDRAGSEVGGEEPYLMEVRQVAIGEGTEFGNPEPIVSVFICSQMLENGRCNETNIVEVFREGEKYVFGRRGILHTDYMAK